MSNLPDKANLVGNPTAGQFKTALGLLYDWISGLHFWGESKTVALGDIVFLPNNTSYKYAECTSAGITGTSEPVWGAVGDTISDGTAIWTMRDLRNPISKVSKAGDAMTGNLEVPSLTIDGRYVSPFNFKNKLINGNFDRWQRGTSFTISNTFGYTSDRWSAIFDGDGAVVSQQLFTIGQTDVPNVKKYCRTVITPVIGNGNRSMLVQKIEDLSLFSEKYVTVSFYAKADTPKNIGLSLGQFTGDFPSSVFGIGGRSIALTTQWKQYTATIYLPSIVGKTLLENSSLWLTFWFSAGSTHDTELGFNLGQQSGTFDIAQVQLEECSTATEFEQRPIAVEEMLCKKYRRNGSYKGTYQAARSGYSNTFIEFDPPMRVAPSVAVSINGTPNAIKINDAGTTTSAITVWVRSNSNFFVNRNQNGADGDYIEFDWTADAEL